MADFTDIDAEDDPFAYRYDTQLLIDRRDKDLDEDEINDYITEHFEGNCLIAVNPGRSLSTAARSERSTTSLSRI